MHILYFKKKNQNINSTSNNLIMKNISIRIKYFLIPYMDDFSLETLKIYKIQK